MKRLFVLGALIAAAIAAKQAYQVRYNQMKISQNAQPQREREYFQGLLTTPATARCEYRERPILFMDEPTAALDPKAEAEIFQNFQTITAGKTAVLVSHRLSSCRFCDCIVVLEHGNIIEQGTHEALMRMNNGKYREMFTAQAEYYHADIDDKENINV